MHEAAGAGGGGCREHGKSALHIACIEAVGVASIDHARNVDDGVGCDHELLERIAAFKVAFDPFDAFARLLTSAGQGADVMTARDEEID